MFALIPAMAAHSLDLRESIMEAIDRGTHSKRELAQLFGVHESFLYKLARQRRELGHVARLPHGGGAQLKLTDEVLVQLDTWIAATPDATLSDLQTQLAQTRQVALSTTTIWRALQTLDWPRKKRPKVLPKLIR